MSTCSLHRLASRNEEAGVSDAEAHQRRNLVDVVV